MWTMGLILLDVVDLVDGSAEGLEFYIGKEPFEISALVKGFDTLNIWMPRALYEGGHDMWWVPAKIGLKG